jgi:hypothetical protein
MELKMNYILLILLVAPLLLYFVFMQTLKKNKNIKAERRKNYRVLVSILPLLELSLLSFYNSLLDYNFISYIFLGISITQLLLITFVLIYIIKKPKNQTITG